MSRGVPDYHPQLKAAIAEAKAAGLDAAAAELESRAFAAFTTSSEMFGEHARAIDDFLRAAGPGAPAPVREKLRACLKAIRGGPSWWPFGRR